MSDTQAAWMSQPFWRYKTISTKSWTTTGNTDTITDTAIKDNSFVLVVPRTTPAGLWSVAAPSNGSVVVTSSDAESAGLVYCYIIL